MDTATQNLHIDLADAWKKIKQLEADKVLLTDKLADSVQENAGLREKLGEAIFRLEYSIFCYEHSVLKERCEICFEQQKKLLKKFEQTEEEPMPRTIEDEVVSKEGPSI